MRWSVAGAAQAGLDQAAQEDLRAYGFGNSITFHFAARAIFDCIARYRPAVIFAFPTVYSVLTKAPQAKGSDLSSLRMAVSAADLLSAEAFNEKASCGCGSLFLELAREEGQTMREEG